MRSLFTQILVISVVGLVLDNLAKGEDLQIAAPVTTVVMIVYLICKCFYLTRAVERAANSSTVVLFKTTLQCSVLEEDGRRCPHQAIGVYINSVEQKGLSVCGKHLAIIHDRRDRLWEACRPRPDE